MNTRLEAFLSEKDPRFDGKLLYAAYGGSRLYGTEDEDSDYDFKAVADLGIDYVLGLHSFDMAKMHSGEGGITSSGDIDVEVYHYDAFVKRAVRGEVNVIETLFAPKEKVVVHDPFIDVLLQNRSLFLSKQVARQYGGMILKHESSAKSPAEKLKKKEKIQRVEAFGYETKEIMKAVLYLRMATEFLKDGVLRLERVDREELKAIKNGSLGSREQAFSYVEEAKAGWKRAYEESHLPERSNGIEINKLLVGFQLERLKLNQTEE